MIEREFSHIAQKLGMLHMRVDVSSDAESRVYGIKIKLKTIEKDIHFPTIADARFYHVFEPASEGQNFGMTIDLESGEQSLPEVVSKRCVLQKIYEDSESEIDVEVFELDNFPMYTPEYFRNRIGRVQKLNREENSI